jgi:hypothetical protein
MLTIGQWAMMPRERREALRLSFRQLQELINKGRVDLERRQ